MYESRWKIFEYTPPQEPLKVLYADEDLLVLSKPHGLLSVAGKPDDHWDCAEYRARKIYPSARIIHRLDMSTSGILVLALNPQAVRVVGLQFEKRKVAKTYVARVWGEVQGESGEIDFPLICDWPNRPLQIVDHELGKPSRTQWRVIGREDGITRLALHPLTGRSHQLRVHLMSIGHPILGDEFYAPDEAFSAADRLQLHASEIGFKHPEGGRDVIFNDPCPF